VILEQLLTHVVAGVPPDPTVVPSVVLTDGAGVGVE
jgi:hypothetical protein